MTASLASPIDGSVGPYRLRHVLGRGGMGIVYAAEHENTGTPAAVKTALRINSLNIAQLRREIFTLSQVRHPGVVTILDHGISDGSPWYAMELIQGATLSDVFAKWWAGVIVLHGASTTMTSNVSARSDEATLPLAVEKNAFVPPAEGTRDVRPPAAGGNLASALGLIRDVCNVLAYLHGEGVVHRDLKPSNVFVRDNGQPVLVDFGMADKLGGRAGREIMRYSDAVIGSMPYMSPEQLRGEVLDARCDLYAVGCLLYEAVTGQPPFVGTSARMASGHLRELPVPMSFRVTEVPDELERLVRALLIKDPRKRFGYAEDVAAVLDEMGAALPSWRTALPAHRPYLYRPPFVGRSETYKKLERRLKEVFIADGGFLFIGGESGAGKTRLALEVANSVRDSGVTIVTGVCANVAAGLGDLNVQDQPLGPVGPLLEAVADRWLESNSHERERLLGNRATLLAPYSPAIAALPGVEQLSPPPPLPVELARERLYEAVSDTIRALGEMSPVVLILEDLHWADELTLGFLEHLATRKPQGMRGVIVGTYRSDECGDRLRALVNSNAVEHCVLRRMNDEEVRQMADGMLNAPPGELVTFLANHSGGNPFFVAEYLRSALHSGALVRTASGGWKVAKADASMSEICASLPAPQALQQVVELRLRRLSKSTRHVLETAAVMGRRIDLPALKLATGLNEEDMLGVIDEMVKAYVWEVGPDGDYRFAHDKLRELPLAELDADRRRLLHGQVAEALERAYRGSEELKARSGAIGHHFAAAGEAEKAVPYLLAGGDAARDVHAIDEAIRLYHLARQQVDRANLPELRTTALAIHEKLGDVLSFGGHYEEAREAFLRALGSAMDHEVPLRVRMLRKIGKTWEVQHDHNRAKQACDEALAILPGGPDELDDVLAHEWVHIVLGRAWNFYWLGRPENMSVEIARVASHVEARGSSLERYQYFMAVVTRDYRQYRYRVSDATLQAGRAALSAAQDHGSLPEVAFAQFVLGFALLWKGQLAQAEVEIWAALEQCRQICDAVGETRATAYAALLHRLRGRETETETVAKKALALAEARAMGDYIGMAQACLAWAALRQDNPNEAERLARAALETWNRLSFPFPFRWCSALLLMKLVLADGSDAGAAEAVQLAKELTAETQYRLPDDVDAPLAAAVRAEAAGDLDGARRQAERAVIRAEELGFI